MRDKIASCKTFLPFNAFLSTEGIVLTFIQNRDSRSAASGGPGVNNTQSIFAFGFTNKQWRCNDE
ncbi:Uncharacterised protein [Escherichia coli]|uniref:Uncharacterized protein n=1 Tax=Escherichia coli TaxID=562 RepID=A0A2X3JPD7_ECOLX|nr:Uncharacterised protein [Escherichia coli]